MSDEDLGRIVEALKTQGRKSPAASVLTTVIAGLLVAGATGLIAAAVTWGAASRGIQDGREALELARENSLILVRLDTTMSSFRAEFDTITKALAEISLRAEQGATDRFTQTEADELEKRFLREISRLEERVRIRGDG